MDRPRGYIQVEPPYPGELLYSALARTLDHLGCDSPKRGLDLLFGDRSIVTTPDLPTFLPHLAWLFARWGCSPRDVARRMTTLPYYLAFRSMAAVRQAQQAMESGRPSLLLQAGAGTHRVRRPSALRYCAQCVAEDVATYGEPYWRCVHQLPAVWYCPKHAVALTSSTVQLDGRTRHAFISLARVIGASGEQICVNEASQTRQLVKIARGSEKLQSGTKAMPREWSRTLRARAGEAGYLERGARARLESDFLAFYSPQLLSSIGAELRPGTDNNWLRALLHPRQRVAPTLYHLLAHQFLDTVTHESAVDLADKVCRRRQFGPELDASIRLLRAEGHNPCAIARKLGVERTSVSLRLNRESPGSDEAPSQMDVAKLATDRDQWTALIQAHPECGTKALRQLAPALYSRLYRKQKAWLATCRPQTISRVQQVTRVDWCDRDAHLLPEVAMAATMIRRQEPPVRVSAARLLQTLKIRALSNRLRRNLPRTTAAIEAHTESIPDFQVRRIHWHADRLIQIGRFSLSALQRAAGLKQLPEWVREDYGAPLRVQPDPETRSLK